MYVCIVCSISDTTMCGRGACNCVWACFFFFFLVVRMVKNTEKPWGTRCSNGFSQSNRTSTLSVMIGRRKSSMKNAGAVTPNKSSNIQLYTCQEMGMSRERREKQSTEGVIIGKCWLTCEFTEVYLTSFKSVRALCRQFSHGVVAQVHEAVHLQNPCCPATAARRPATLSGLLSVFSWNL